MKDKVKKVCLWISLIYLLFYIFFFWFRWPSGYSLTNNYLVNLLLLGFFVLPLLPIFWFFFIKILWMRITAYTIYLIAIIILHDIVLASFMVFLFTLNDAISMNNNGYRPVFEKHIKKNEWLVIYRTPDQGALGGDHLFPAIVQKIVPGLEKREFLDEKDIILDKSNDSNYVSIGDQKYCVPKEEELRKHGNLNLK